MGKTKRNADHWFEDKIKNKDQSELGNLWWDYTNPRCIQRIRRNSETFYSQKLDPRTLKPLGWKEFDSDYKTKSKRSARRAAKILIKIEAHIIMQEVWDEFWEELWSMDVDVDNDNWYEVLPFDQDWEMKSYQEEYDYYYGCDYHYRDPWDLYY